jgi:hypothetical protein
MIAGWLSGGHPTKKERTQRVLMDCMALNLYEDLDWKEVKRVQFELQNLGP